MPFFDGVNERIYYRAWEVDEPIAGLVFLHGGGEHSGQYSRLAARLNANGVNVWAPDHQGHGISGGTPGEVTSIETLVGDVQLLVDIVSDGFPGLPLTIGGHSLGSVTTAAVITANPSSFAGAILVGWRGAAPSGDSPVRAEPDGSVRFDTSRLAADPDYLEELTKDPLVHLVLPNAAGLLSAIAESAERTAAAFADLTIPMLLINGTRESRPVLDNGRRWAAELPNVRLLEIDDGLHNVVNDVDYRQVVAAIGEFVLDVTATPAHA